MNINRSSKPETKTYPTEAEMFDAEKIVNSQGYPGLKSFVDATGTKLHILIQREQYRELEKELNYRKREIDRLREMCLQEKDIAYLIGYYCCLLDMAEKTLINANYEKGLDNAIEIINAQGRPGKDIYNILDLIRYAKTDTDRRTDVIWHKIKIDHTTYCKHIDLLLKLGLIRYADFLGYRFYLITDKGVEVSEQSKYFREVCL